MRSSLSTALIVRPIQRTGCGSQAGSPISQSIEYANANNSGEIIGDH
jgi:hypothetical protein